MGNGLREQGRRTGKENEEENGEGERGERTWIEMVEGEFPLSNRPPSPILVYYVDPVKREGWGLSYWPSCKVSAS